MPAVGPATAVDADVATVPVGAPPASIYGRGSSNAMGGPASSGRQSSRRVLVAAVFTAAVVVPLGLWTARGSLRQMLGLNVGGKQRIRSAANPEQISLL